MQCGPDSCPTWAPRPGLNVVFIAASRGRLCTETRSAGPWFGPCPLLPDVAENGEGAAGQVPEGAPGVGAEAGPVHRGAGRCGLEVLCGLVQHEDRRQDVRLQPARRLQTGPEHAEQVMQADDDAVYPRGIRVQHFALPVRRLSQKVDIPAQANKHLIRPDQSERIRRLTASSEYLQGTLGRLP